MHRLLDVLPGRIVYATNRRNGVDFDVVIRSVVTGAEQVVYDRGGMVQEVEASPDSRYLALTLPGSRPLSDQVVLIDTMPATEGEHVRALTAVDADARNTHLRWLPRSAGLVVSSNHGREFTGISKIEPRNGRRSWL